MNKLRVISALLTTAVFLASCARSDREVIEASCNKAEDNKAFCSCLTEKMAEMLPGETLTRIADSIRDGAETPQEAISHLPVADQIKALTVIPQLFSCSPGKSSTTD